jgi:hypothetical protein
VTASTISLLSKRPQPKISISSSIISQESRIYSLRIAIRRRVHALALAHRALAHVSPDTHERVLVVLVQVLNVHIFPAYGRDHVAVVAGGAGVDGAQTTGFVVFVPVTRLLALTGGRGEKREIKEEEEKGDLPCSTSLTPDYLLGPGLGMFVVGVGSFLFGTETLDEFFL